MSYITPHIILGIDPGTLVMGFGLIAVGKSSVGLVEMGVLQLARHKDHSERLKLIYNQIESLIKIHRPLYAAIEAPFFGKNVQSMLKLGRAQGVAIAAAAVNGVEAIEYSPNKVKQSITGRGHATKEQVWEMIRHTLSLQEESPQYWDATDAIAVALCHHYTNRLPAALLANPDVPAAKRRSSSSKSATWEAFAALHPGRVER